MMTYERGKKVHKLDKKKNKNKVFFKQTLPDLHSALLLDHFVVVFLYYSSTKRQRSPWVTDGKSCQNLHRTLIKLSSYGLFALYAAYSWL